VLVDGELKLWESAAIMMHLAIQAKDDLWPLSDPARQVEIVRWLSNSILVDILRR
jgi:glutathione S-transferase